MVASRRDVADLPCRRGCALESEAVGQGGYRSRMEHYSVSSGAFDGRFGAAGVHRRPKQRRVSADGMRSSAFAHREFGQGVCAQARRRG